MCRFSSGLPCAISRPSSPTISAKPLLADADAVDHPPELFEGDLADDPADVLLRIAAGARRSSSSAAGRRPRSTGAMKAPSGCSRACSGTVSRLLPMRAGRDGRPASSKSVISRNSRKLEDVVLEDAVLLPRRRGRSTPAPRRPTGARAGCSRMYMLTCSATCLATLRLPVADRLLGAACAAS